jgi:CHAT domain-containing protein
VGHGKQVPRVIVIADGSLVNLNFETLIVPTEQPHYWIEDATISNASSIALLSAATHNGPMTRLHDRTMLLIGAPNYAGTGFPDLSQATNEVDRIEHYFPSDDRTIIEGKAAVPAAYDEAKPGQFTYIHFVAHGTASRLSPLDSSIILSRQGDAYKLYARDIMQQPLKADLVTILACYGAGNRAYSGEGLVGLSWAFLRAGAHNVIAALWEVNDASTPRLMDNLYKNINNGENPATALRHAKLDMLHSDTVYRRPFYWGAFQLYVGS